METMTVIVNGKEEQRIIESFEFDKNSDIRINIIPRLKRGEKVFKTMGNKTIIINTGDYNASPIL